MPTEKPRITLTFERDEKEMLELIAIDRGDLSQSRALGLLIREEYARIQDRQRKSKNRKTT